MSSSYTIAVTRLGAFHSSSSTSRKISRIFFFFYYEFWPVQYHVYDHRRGQRVTGIYGSLIWSKTLMELIFNPCDEFQWSLDGRVGQIHSPHLHIGAPGIFSDLLKSVQMLKRKWGAERNGKLPHLIIPSKSAALLLSLRWNTCLRQNCSLGSYACSEGPALGQNTLMMIMMMMISFSCFKLWTIMNTTDGGQFGCVRSVSIEGPAGSRLGSESAFVFPPHAHRDGPRDSKNLSIEDAFLSVFILVHLDNFHINSSNYMKFRLHI